MIPSLNCGFASPISKPREAALASLPLAIID